MEKTGPDKLYLDASAEGGSAAQAEQISRQFLSEFGDTKADPVTPDSCLPAPLGTKAAELTRTGRGCNQ